jgi:hypothetical protein
MITRNIQFVPILIGATKTYAIDMPSDAKPFWFKTMTTEMTAHKGVVERIHGRYATIRMNDQGFIITGEIVGPVVRGCDGYAIEHLTVEGKLEYLISDYNFLSGNQNFANFGTPERFVRIDIYTGESKVINA